MYLLANSVKVEALKFEEECQMPELGPPVVGSMTLMVIEPQRPDAHLLCGRQQDEGEGYVPSQCHNYSVLNS